MFNSPGAIVVLSFVIGAIAGPALLAAASWVVVTYAALFGWIA